MFPLWKGNCISFGNPSKNGRKLSITDLTMGISSRRRRHDSGSDITFSDCFEILCTRSTMQKHRGTFFSIVRRKIGDLNIIMAGEVDCSTSMNMEPSLKDYIELKTTYKVNPLFPPRWRDQLFPKWYLQSWMLGVQVLQVGYRDSRNRVLTIRQKPVNEVLRDAQKYAPYFNPDVDIGRVHAILSTLLGYFRSLGSSVSAQEKFELHVDANGDAWVTSPTNSNPTG
ncbi:hypothetical protein BDM02DRAFT_901105 [Thelephora ganbajun]|uniref:Uncharacterized protein n=1 Tax=Thelephora ganbajun TaxID=370292 RepID=A0ACB6ZP51_THEGA|nr:hypothetical protein BDM02DRAFT_901105 [Thelephora ganbajun]